MDFIAKLNTILKTQEVARFCNITVNILLLPWYPMTFIHIIPSKFTICLMHGLWTVFISYDLFVTFHLSSYCQCYIHQSSDASTFSHQTVALLWLTIGRYLHSFYEYLQQVSRKHNHSKSQCCPLVFENILMLYRWSAFNARMFPWVGMGRVLKSDTLATHCSRIRLCTQFYTLQHSRLLVWSHTSKLFNKIKLHSSLYCIINVLLYRR
jgi:hypothetical protein